jgi:hypothetical protein
MKFDPAIHTKEFLLNNLSLLGVLGEISEEFAKSALCEDYELLSSIPPTAFPDRCISPLAGLLARYQGSWLQSVAANNFDILKLQDSEGWTVAHLLASYHADWIHSEAAKTIAILKLKNIDGRSVAYELIHRASCVSHAPLFTKEILTLVWNNKLLAESIAEKQAQSHGLTVATMAVKLISQGAAYKHSRIMTIADGQTILNEAKQLIEDCLEPEVALKHAQALYSTCFHNVEKIKLLPSQKGLDKWQAILNKAEAIMRDVIQKHPSLEYSTTKIDIFCEPSADLVSRLKAETILNNLVTHELNQADINDDLTINNGLY